MPQVRRRTPRRKPPCPPAQHRSRQRPHHRPAAKTPEMPRREPPADRPARAPGRRPTARCAARCSTSGGRALRNGDDRVVAAPEAFAGDEIDHLLTPEGETAELVGEEAFRQRRTVLL